MSSWSKAFSGQPQRPDLAAMVASGLFDECASAVAAVAAAGVEGLHDTDHTALLGSLALLRNCRSQPGCEAKIRRLAPALAFCLEHDLDYTEQFGSTRLEATRRKSVRDPKLSHRVGNQTSHIMLTSVRFPQAAVSSAEMKVARTSPSRSSMSTCF